VFGSGLLCLTALGAALLVLPRYVTGPAGAGDVAVGVVIGAFAMGAIGARQRAGPLADAQGRRSVFSAGALVTGLAGALLFVPAGVPGLVLARLVLGLGEALVSPPRRTWVVDLAPPGRRARAIGLFGLAVWTSLSVAALGGERVFGRGGYSAVWVLSVAVPLAGAALVRRLPDPHRPPPPGGERAALLPRQSLRPGFALGLASIAYATMASFVVLHLDPRAWAGARRSSPPSPRRWSLRGCSPGACDRRRGGHGRDGAGSRLWGRAPPAGFRYGRRASVDAVPPPQPCAPSAFLSSGSPMAPSGCGRGATPTFATSSRRAATPRSRAGRSFPRRTRPPTRVPSWPVRTSG